MSENADRFYLASKKSNCCTFHVSPRRRRRMIRSMTTTTSVMMIVIMVLGMMMTSAAVGDPFATATAAASRLKFAHPSAPRPPLDVSSSSSSSLTASGSTTARTSTAPRSTTPTLVTGYGSRHYRRTHLHHHHHHRHHKRGHLRRGKMVDALIAHAQLSATSTSGGLDASFKSASSSSSSSSLWIEQVRDQDGGGLRVWVLPAQEDSSSLRRISSSANDNSHNSTMTMIRILPSPLPYQQQERSRRNASGGEQGAVWNLQICSSSTSSSTSIQNMAVHQPAIPVQGLYGVYQLASGQVWVWIARSNVVYTAPCINDNERCITQEKDQNDDIDAEPWFQIHKVQELVLHHVPYTTTTNTATAAAVASSSSSSNNNTTSSRGISLPAKRKLTRSQQKEEHRQLALLRQALKDHDWYYATGSLVPDLTRNLQATLLLTTSSSRVAAARRISSSSTSNEEEEEEVKEGNDDATRTQFIPWWKAALGHNNNPDTNDNRNHHQQQHGQHPPPESRFFWNEALLEPLLQQATIDENQQRNSSTPSAAAAAAAARLLLDHSIPITSAFCGVQRNQTIGTRRNKSGPTTSSLSSSSSIDCCYDQILLTRRSRFRAGTRFTKRGADSTGAVANYAETEQIVLLYNQSCDSATVVKNKEDRDDSSSRSLQQVCSHVQTRGSIPLRWSSPADIKTYRPRVRIGTDPLAQARAVRQHLAQEAQHYMMIASSSSGVEENNHIVAKANPLNRKHPAIVLVNLVDQRSDQGRLGLALDAVLNAVLDVYSEQPDSDLPFLNSTYIRHVWYDFHAQVKGGRWNRLQLLLEDVQAPLHEQAFFRATVKDKNSNRGAGNSSGGDNSIRSLEIDQLQTGVIRTNCMDCLDRTNVVQGIFSRSALFAQLSPALPLSMKTAFRKNPLTLPWKTGEVAHRHLWADNADAISRLYSGTAALKRDFTRTGKRTKKGALDDGMNSLQRYFLNNFLDADRQEGIDLLTRFQEFSNVYDVAGDNDDDDGTVSDNSSTKGMTIQEAARQLLLGQLPRQSKDDYDDADHVRIKINRDKRFGTSTAFLPRRKSPVDLLWLPGDLQTQMRDLATSSSLQRETDGAYSPQSALEEMDRRAADPFPWWMVASDSSLDEDSDAGSSVGSGDNDDPAVKFAPLRLEQDRVASVEATGGKSGFILASLVASARAPLATAALVLALTGLSFASTFAITPSFTINLSDADIDEIDIAKNKDETEEDEDDEDEAS